jgi:hypothetical protein
LRSSVHRFSRPDQPGPSSTNITDLPCECRPVPLSPV